jgi:hypothetical protein
MGATGDMSYWKRRDKGGFFKEIPLRLVRQVQRSLVCSPVGRLFRT